MHVSNQSLTLEFEPPHVSHRAALRDLDVQGADPRVDMAGRLPAFVQPFLTWLTAKPAPDEAAASRTPMSYVVEALLMTFGGCALSAAAFALLGGHAVLFWIVLPAGLLATTSGLGLFQVVIFHHCSHGTVFSTREAQPAGGAAGLGDFAVQAFRSVPARTHACTTTPTSCSPTRMNSPILSWASAICGAR